MQIKILNPIEVPNWNDQIAELPGATIFHTSNWARVLTDSYGYKPKYFCTFNNGSINNLIPAMEINSPFTGKRGVSLPFSDHVNPLAEDKKAFEKILEEMVSFGRNNGWRTIDFHGGNGFFSTKESYTSFIFPYIDLNGSFKSLFNEFRGSTRRNIRKAEKLGVKAKISNSKRSLAEFYRLNCLTRKMHGLPPQPDFFFDNIHKNILSGDKGYTCLGYYKDEIIAGVVFFILNGHAIYKYGASDERYLHLRPNNLVMAEAISCAFNYGVENIDLGRTENDHRGQLQFKMGWRADFSLVHYFKIDIRKNRFITSPSKIKSSYFVFKKLPTPLLKLLGKMSYRHIG